MRLAIIFCVIMLFVVDIYLLNYCFGIPCWYIRKCYRDWRNPQPKVLMTEFYQDGQLIAVRMGDCRLSIDGVELDRKLIIADTDSETQEML